MVSLNVKNLRNLIKKVFVSILVIALICYILFGAGYIVRYMHILNFNSIPQGGYLCFAYPFVGMLFTVALFVSANTLTSVTPDGSVNVADRVPFVPID